jgi:hypothetical protein
VPKAAPRKDVDDLVEIVRRATGTTQIGVATICGTRRVDLGSSSRTDSPCSSFADIICSFVEDDSNDLR